MSEPQEDRLHLTWLGRFEAIQWLPDTSDWLVIALETLKTRDPVDAERDTDMLWRLSVIRAAEVAADTEKMLEDIGL